MPAPIASYGNNASIGGAVNAQLAPEYEIVHGATDLAAALSELPALVGGDTSVTPSSGLGTNATAATKQVPKAVIVGGGVPASEVDQLKAAISGVPIIQVSKEDVAAAGGTGPDPVLITKLIKEKLVAAGI
ncbi:hypothetical protein OQA88_5503 [Cercophora sp. LCS_1]